MAEQGEIRYNSPTNVQVGGSDGNFHRAQLVTTVYGDVRYKTPDNSPNVEVMGSDGNYHRATLVAIEGGGSDAHNKGWFASESALSTAYPEGEDGDYAIVGETDTVWVWDSDSDSWLDTARKGQVESVNGETGIVLLDAEDVGAVPVPDITTISTSSSSLTLEDNTIYNCGTMTALTFTNPSTPTTDYSCQVNFTSGSTATTIALSTGTEIIWLGDNVNENTGFVPRANCRYIIMFTYDGSNIRGIVQGVSIA